VQNGQDADRCERGKVARALGLHAYYIPGWPMPGLIPRDARRGDVFENIAFFGIEGELDPGLRGPKWGRRLAEMGLDWTAVPSQEWTDYSDVDAVVAARDFGYPGEFLLKPPSKLINAWHARVPAILGPESAFRHERRSDLDYLEVSSPGEIIEELCRLRDDSSLRKAVVEQGAERAREVSAAAIVSRWQHLIDEVAVPAYHDWVRSTSKAKRAFFLRRAVGIPLDNALRPLVRTRHLSRQLVRHRADWR
jgi:hypothetical protein